MATLTELQYTSDWLKGEVQSPNKFTRDQIVVSNPGGAAVTYPGGLVLAKSGSNYIIVAPAASDGTAERCCHSRRYRDHRRRRHRSTPGASRAAQPFSRTSTCLIPLAPQPTRKRQL
jgi:hypothetical protein